MDRLELLKSLAAGETVNKTANIDDILAVGNLTLMLHNILHARDADDDGPDFANREFMEKSDLSIVERLVNFIKKDEETGTDVTLTPSSVVKAFDEEQGLITSLVLRPDETDLHGDTYTAEEVEKACHDFNVHCRKTNIQHTKMADFDIVESYISKSSFELGDGEVKKGDWIAVMHVPPASEIWKKVKKGEFTGFSIGCTADVEMIDD